MRHYQDEHFIVGYDYSWVKIYNINPYRMLYKSAASYALSKGRELAEGPTILIMDNYEGPVELWPLATEAKNAVSR